MPLRSIVPNAGSVLAFGFGCEEGFLGTLDDFPGVLLIDIQHRNPGADTHGEFFVPDWGDRR